MISRIFPWDAFYSPFQLPWNHKKYQILDWVDEIRVMIVPDAIFLPDASSIRISSKYFQNISFYSLQVNVTELKILKVAETSN